MDTTSAGSGVTPHFVSVKEAAVFLNTTPWSVYQLLDAVDAEGNPIVDSRYDGRRRKVVLESLREYAKRMPREKPEAS